MLGTAISSHAEKKITCEARCRGVQLQACKQRSIPHLLNKNLTFASGDSSPSVASPCKNAAFQPDFNLTWKAHPCSLINFPFDISRTFFRDSQALMPSGVLKLGSSVST